MSPTEQGPRPLVTLAALYHLMLDSTALDLDVCIELMVATAEARSRDPRSTATT